MEARALAEKAILICRQIATFSESDANTTRTFLSPPMRDVHKLLRSWMESLGMSVRIDAAGNVRGEFESEQPSPKRLIIGSHLDTVPDAGAFDGILGVVVGIALVEQLQGRRLSFTVEIVGFSEEEGVRFGFPFIGSYALVGELTAELLDKKDSNEVSVKEAVANFGLDSARLDEAKIDNDVAAYLEFHIEQGPELEALNERIAVVSSVVGQSRLSIRFVGNANHAGTTPMHLRKDALAAAAEWMVSVEALAQETVALVATVGMIAALPGAENVIPGEALLSLDVRASDDSVRENALAVLIDRAAKIAARRGIEFESKIRLSNNAVPMDGNIQEMLAAAMSVCGYGTRSLASGAGHDAMVLARYVPTGMLFLRSPSGISHHPDESVLVEDVQAAIEVGAKFLEIFAQHV